MYIYFSSGLEINSYRSTQKTLRGCTLMTFCAHKSIDSVDLYCNWSTAFKPWACVSASKVSSFKPSCIYSEKCPFPHSSVSAFHVIVLNCKESQPICPRYILPCILLQSCFDLIGIFWIRFRLVMMQTINHLLLFSFVNFSTS